MEVQTTILTSSSFPAINGLRMLRKVLKLHERAAIRNRKKSQCFRCQGRLDIRMTSKGT